MTQKNDRSAVHSGSERRKGQTVRGMIAREKARKSLKYVKRTKASMISGGVRGGREDTSLFKIKRNQRGGNRKKGRQLKKKEGHRILSSDKKKREKTKRLTGRFKIQPFTGTETEE